MFTGATMAIMARLDATEGRQHGMGRVEKVNEKNGCTKLARLDNQSSCMARALMRGSTVH